MLLAEDFDELVFSCSELLVHDRNKLVNELSEAVEESPRNAATVFFAVLHAAFDLDLKPEEVKVLFYLVDARSQPLHIKSCYLHLAEVEARYYKDYMAVYKGKPVFDAPQLWQ